MDLFTQILLPTYSAIITAISITTATLAGVAQSVERVALTCPALPKLGTRDHLKGV